MLDKPKLLLTTLLFLFFTYSKAQVKYVDSLENTRSIITMFIDFNVDSVLYNYYGKLDKYGELNNQFIYLFESEINGDLCLEIALESYDTNKQEFSDKGEYDYLVERTNRYLNVRNKFLIPVINEFDTRYNLQEQNPINKHLIDRFVTSHPEILIYRIKDRKVLGIMGPYGGEIRPIRNGSNATIQIGIDLINLSGQRVDLDSAASDIETYLEEVYQGTTTFNDKEFTVKSYFSVYPVERISETTDRNLLLILAEFGLNDEFQPEAKGISSSSPGKVAFIDVNYFQGAIDTTFGTSGVRIAAREIGHLLGLSEDLEGAEFNGRLMQTDGIGTNITDFEFGLILQGIRLLNKSVYSKFIEIQGNRFPIKPFGYKEALLKMDVIERESRKKQ